MTPVPALADVPSGSIIAHRGGALHVPEHTMDGYRVAVAQGIPVLESDVHLLADGSLGVIHDGTVDRTTTSTGNVADHTAASFHQLLVDASDFLGGGWADARPPLLSEVLLEFGNRIVLAIDVKTAGATGEVVDALDRHGIDPASILLQSFNRDDCMTAVARGWSVVKLGSTDVAAVATDGIPWIGPDYKQITRRFCADAHAAGLKVATWTVNRRYQRDALRAAGVDLIFSDDPAYLHSDRVRGRTDLFGRQAWMPGMQANNGDRGRFHADDGSWGFDLDGDDRRFALTGHVCPTDPDVFTLDLRVRFDATDADGCASVFLSTSDRSYAGTGLAGADGYLFLLGSSGALAVHRVTDGVATPLAQCDDDGAAVPPGTYVPLRITVDPTTLGFERSDAGPDACGAVDGTHRGLAFLHFGGQSARVRFKDVVFS